MLLEEIADATLDGTRKELMAQHESVALLLIDDLGMRKLPASAAEDLLEIIMRRHKRASTIMTSNRPVDDWGKLLGDTPAVSAMLDRLLDDGMSSSAAPRAGAHANTPTCLRRRTEVLRFYHPSALEVRAPCWMGLMGRVSPGNSTVLYRASSMKDLPCINEATVLVGIRSVAISREWLQYLTEAGLAKVSRMILKAEPTELEQAVLNAIAIFSWGVASQAPRDRLLHALFSIESLLLANETEPMTSSVGYRMAFLIKSDADSRKDLIAEMSKGYRLRGKFVHHGINPDDIQLMNRVIRLCWLAIIEIIGSTDRFTTKDELIDALQNQLLS